MLVRQFYAAPAGAAGEAGTAAPWAVLLAGAIAFLMLWPVLATLSARPGQSLADLAAEVGGRPAAIAVVAALTFYLIVSAGINLRQLSEMTVTAIYPHTPQTFAMATVTVAAVVGAVLDAAGLAWLGSIYAMPAAFSILLILVGNIGWTNYRAVLPLTGHGILPTALALVPMTSYFSDAVYLTIYCRFLSPGGQATRSAMKAVGTTMLVSALVLLVFLMVFPLPFSLEVPFPLFELTRLVRGGRYVERLDSLWILFWAFGTAGLIAGGLQVTALLWRDAFRLPSHRDAVYPLAVAMIAVALFPVSQADAVGFETTVLRRYGFLLTLVLPLLVALWARLRRGRRHA